MELRSTRKRLDSVEYNELQVSLSEFGCYESDMELQEMRHLMSALRASLGTTEIDGSNEQSMDVALPVEGCPIERQTKPDFLENDIIDLSSALEVHNSTMIIPNASNHHLPFSSSCSPCDSPSATQGNPATLPYKSFYLRCSSSPFSSPELPKGEFTIRAEIHHEQDWSPPASSPPSPPLASPSCRNCCNSSSVTSEKSPVASAALKRAPNRKRSTINDVTYALTTTNATTFLVIDEKRKRLEEVSTSSSSFYNSSTLSSSYATASVSASHFIPEESTDSGIDSSFCNATTNENLDCCSENVPLPLTQIDSYQFITVNGTDCNNNDNHGSNNIHLID